jgi:hypothetical protein
MRIQPAEIRMRLRKARRRQRRGITVAPAAQQRLIGGNSIKAEGEKYHSKGTRAKIQENSAAKKSAGSHPA